MQSVSEVELLAQLARLEREERQVSARRRKLHDRIASFPTPEHERSERELSRYRRDLHRQIEAVHAEVEAIRAELPVPLPAPLLRESVIVRL